ncbi:MAG TPA: DUF3533 domain-containing protein [Aeromicrobium sp.]|nr:DUF3533 domain-containing protein [Aeromicrobium sp.]
MTKTATLRQELSEAISPRTAVLIAGVLLLQLGFIAGYVGAFHDPTPHHLKIAVVGPAQATGPVIDQLTGLDGEPVDATALTERNAAIEQVKSGDLVAALVLNTSGTQDELLVATGGGASLATAVEQAAEQTEIQQDRTLTITDVVPLEAEDARGLSGFYAVIGWIVGGYLMAALLGVSRGSRPANPHRAAIRLASMIPYAIVAGIGGALVLDQWLGALTGHFWALAALGALLVLASATVTTALQVVFGTIGIGLAVLLFVVLGNPSAGGAFQWDLLPAFWRTIGPWIPNGAGTEAARLIVYFDGAGLWPYLGIIGAYAATGAVITMLASLRFNQRKEVTA